MTAPRASDALDAALRALAARDHTRASLASRLARRGIGDAEQQETVEALARAGYLDDGRFARGRAAALAGRGAGDALIHADLRRQGVPDETTAAAIAALEPERARAERLVAARGSTARTARLLAAKGFAEESLEALVADIDGGTIG